MKDIILTIFVNLFIANSTMLCDIWAATALITAVLMEENELWLFHNMQINVFLFIIIVLFKYTSLPILYNVMEKKSKNKYINIFIKNLKNNKNLRICILFIPMLFALKILLLHNINQPFWMSAINPIVVTYFGEHLTTKFYAEVSLVYFLFISWFSSYLVLFLYWDIKKKREDQKIQENSLSN